MKWYFILKEPTSQLTNQPTKQPANQPGLSLKIEYLSKHWSDITEIYLSLGGPTNFQKRFEWRWPPMEDALKY